MVKEFLLAVVKWIFSHKKVVFIYTPLLCFFLVTLFVGYVYMSWLGDKADALEKLARYKRLIDRTQEIREGYVYSLREAGLGAKVVDIPTRIYDRNDEIIGEFFEQKREIVPYNYIPKYLIRAVIASEDRDFYQHNGVNIKGIFRAMIVNVLHFRVVQGGSTITQQLAKVLFTDMERTL
ncbi:MAG TPA: biosynthetic peptidoglycan transglycosylase, partial [Spirochaetota bacterium]|nr:biosynthetic peptidoglycan transglycosylase [Spirochaetota bacterium]